MYNAVDVWLQLICNKFQRRHYHYLLSFIIDKIEKFPFETLRWQGEKKTRRDYSSYQHNVIIFL